MTKLIDKLTMNPAQQFVIDSRMLESGFSCILQLPTGSGKTWLARRAILNTLKQGLRAVYLTPLRALADELYPLWKSEFSPYEVGVFTGDYGQSGREFPVAFSDAHVLIMTPERLDACTRSWRSHWHWLPQVDLIVVDEIHLLGEKHRGARLEGAISRFSRLNPFCKFICLSATLGNREELADWLHGIEYESTWRSVPLTWRIRHFRKADEKPELLAQEILHARDTGGRSLVFVQSRRRCEVLSAYLTDQGIRAAYHHAGLTHKARRSVEQTLRSSEIDALISTGTLEMGLNMPVRQVVLYDTQFFDGSRFMPLSVNTVWQRAGRAGRPGFDSSGEAVIFAPAWDRSSESYPKGRFERIESALNLPAALAEQVIAEIGSGLCRSEAQLEHALSKSLAAFQGKSLSISKTIDEMIHAEMIRTVSSNEEKDSGQVQLAATPLGRIVTRHLLQPATVLMAQNLFKRLHHFTHFDALFTLALTPDCEPVIPVDFEELPALAQQLTGIASYAAMQLPEARLWFHKPTGKRVLSALKTAALLLAWSQVGQDDTVAKEFGLYPFELIRLQESFDRLLLAAVSTSKYTTTPSRADAEDAPPLKSEATQRIELLHNMIANILPAEAATLTLVKGIGGRWARRLRERGFPNIHALASATLEDLESIPGLSKQRATAWLLSARSYASTPIPSNENTAPRISCENPSTNMSTEARDPYRARRAMDLRVSPDPAGGYTVSGGLEPHKVRATEADWVCDCADFVKGNLCKHIIAVRTYHDQSMRRMPAMCPRQPQSHSHINLLELWFEP
jgi:helicase